MLQGSGEPGPNNDYNTTASMRACEVLRGKHQIRPLSWNTVEGRNNRESWTDTKDHYCTAKCASRKDKCESKLELTSRRVTLTSFSSQTASSWLFCRRADSNFPSFTQKVLCFTKVTQVLLEVMLLKTTKIHFLHSVLWDSFGCCEVQ